MSDSDLAVDARVADTSSPGGSLGICRVRQFGARRKFDREQACRVLRGQDPCVEAVEVDDEVLPQLAERHSRDPETVKPL